MFALTQDKLKIAVGKPTFYLIISILNMASKSDHGSFFLNDPSSSLASPPSSTSMHSSKSTSPSQLPLMNLNVNSKNTNNMKNACEIDYDENDDIVYRRIYDRCKNVFDQLISAMKEEDKVDIKTSHSNNDDYANGCENDLEESECRKCFFYHDYLN